ncbi:MAG: thioredoxin fold domain-containing protein [Burkholderiales bacterium]|nr:thioredoxin fold domain-containing protein [Burkholderiales bacterium]
MKKTSFTLLLTTALLLSIAGCSPQDATTKSSATTANPAQSYADVAAKTRGFTVGALMSANTVYVLFDPQCPHCGHLWQQAQPLLKKVKFVWIPVAFINAKSTPQGAALLAAANPTELMSSHEASILAGTGGIPASASIPSDIEAAIKANTQLLTSMGVESVPYLIAKHSQTGQVVTNTGAMETAALAHLLGLESP